MKIRIESMQSDLSIGGLVIDATNLMKEAAEQNDKVQTAMEDYQYFKEKYYLVMPNKTSSKWR